MKLSFEHIPPKAAFNDRGILYSMIEDLLARDDRGRLLEPRRRKQNRGAGDYTLCERCNKDTGQWYGRSYVAWAYQGMQFRQFGGSSLALPFFIFPGQLAKQIFCMFASACGSEFFDAAPKLRKYVLDRDARGIPESFSLYCYMLSPNTTRNSRQSGLTGALVKGTEHTFSEICFPPFGYILTIESAPPEPGLTDITFFTLHAYHEFRELHLPMPLREVNSYYPADFRTEEEWGRAMARASAYRPTSGRNSSPTSGEVR